MDDRIDPALTGVPETLLWTLYHRAVEARRPDTVLPDPKAVELVDALDYPFAEHFGDPGTRGQWQALRTRCFDTRVRRFLDAHPDGQVVALGEGLETQFWRVDNGTVRWLGVDLPEVAALRERLLPGDPRKRSVATSVLDETWLDEVDSSRGVLVTAQGLFMYLPRADVHRTLATIARRLTGQELVFDSVVRWFSQQTTSERGLRSGAYRTPPMPWGVDAAELRALRALPNIADLRRLHAARGRGFLFGYALPLADRLPAVRALNPIWILSAALGRGQPA